MGKNSSNVTFFLIHRFELCIKPCCRIYASKLFSDFRYNLSNICSFLFVWMKNTIPISSVTLVFASSYLLLLKFAVVYFIYIFSIYIHNLVLVNLNFLSFPVFPELLYFSLVFASIT